MEVMPAAPPPPGQESNFNNPPSRAPQAIAVISFLTALAFVIVCMRFYTKLIITKMFGKDDVFSGLALVSATVIAAYSIAALKDGGLGPHMWDVPVTDFDAAYSRRLLATEVGFPIASFFVKGAVLLLLLRLFPQGTTRYAPILCYIGLAMILVFNIVNFVILADYCIPDGGVCAGHNAAVGKVSQASAGFNMFIDLYILAIPVPIVLGLNMAFPRKIALVGVFTTGLLACLCSILTLYYRVAFANTTDPSWVEVPAIITGNAESMIGIITGCLPCLPALSRHLQERGFYSFRSILSLVSFTRTSREHSEGLVELRDVDTQSKKDGKKSGSLSEGIAGPQDWVYNKQGGTPTTRDQYDAV